LAPFLNKPFTVDDPEYLNMARQILRSPLHPMNFDVCWNLFPACTKAYSITVGNTLMGYLLVPTIMSGGAEWVAHLTQLVFAWIAVLSMSALILRMGWSGGHATAGSLLMVAVPPFLPMASTAMPDVVALAVGLAGIERLAAWRSERKWHQGLLAALALGLAGIARPHLALLLPLGAFFLLESVKPQEILVQVRKCWRLWLPVLGGGCVLLAVILATRESGVLLNPPPAFRGVGNIKPNLRSYALYLCFPLPLAACWAFSRWRTGPRRLALTVLAASGAALWRHQFQLGLALAGCCVLTDLVWEAWRSRDQRQMFPVLWLLIPLPIAYYGHLPIKYLLPCMPAMILICFRLAQDVPARVARALGIVSIAAGLGYSLLILRADMERAEFGRDAMRELIQPHVLAGEKVWCEGHFDAYWYAPLAGAEVVVPGAREPQPGDLLAVGPKPIFRAVRLSLFPKRSMVQKVTHRYRFGRTAGEGAGLYTNALGAWLWTFRNGADESFELWRIE
jgi:hypothetical protein